MSLEITAEQRRQMEEHAARSYPFECCGFLLGTDAGGVKQVQTVLRAENQREDSPKNRYSIDPGEFVRTDRKAREDGQEILGFYHSHPDHPAYPSEFDREHAWPYYSYIIFSVEKGRIVDAHSWLLDEDRSQFREETAAGLRDGMTVKS